MKASIERAKFPAHMIAGFCRAYRPKTLLSETFRDEGECCPTSRPFRLRLIARDLFGTLRIEVRVCVGLAGVRPVKAALDAAKGR